MTGFRFGRSSLLVNVPQQVTNVTKLANGLISVEACANVEKESLSPKILMLPLEVRKRRRDRDDHMMQRSSNLKI
jgi:hypothetical protein